MPISKYYGGHGEEVMSNMQQEYGSEKGKRVFYATANKRKSDHMRRMLDHAKRMSALKAKMG